MLKSPGSPLVILLLCLAGSCVDAKFHHLSLKDESRRNIQFTKFGFNENGTMEFVVSNFTVPTVVLSPSEANKFGIIGFTLSRGDDISESARVNPHLCQLKQIDQDLDSLFFTFDFETSSIRINRSGAIKDIRLCPDFECLDEPNKYVTPVPQAEPSILGKLFGSKKKPTGIPYYDFIPLNETNGAYSFKFLIRFNSTQRGLFHSFFHNCFNYHNQGHSNKIAVDFTIDIVEMNQGSHLSAGDIPKPQLYILVSFLFSLAAIVWINLICKSETKNVFFVHKLMAFLITLKVLSTFCHGMNFYFLSLYGMEREIWAILFYITHLLKGALLFGTLILIGTGYTFFKNFLTTRDRNLFMVVLPLQVLDNIALIVLEESEIGSQQYVFWFEIFTLLDLFCCACVLFPIIWSIRHLKQSSMADGKEFNIRKIRLFRQFYLVTIFYIYSTRMGTFFLNIWLPYNVKFLSEVMNELISLAFFVFVGYKFRPVKANLYLKIAQSDSDSEDAEAVTQNGLFENVIKVNRIQNEIDELIPGTIGGGTFADTDSDNDEDELLPKVPR